jgi:hypothetical protein
MKFRISILILGIIILYIPHFVVPINEIDTGWDFSHSYGIWRGHYLWIDYISRPTQYLYGFIIAPFSYFFNGIYLPSIFYSIITLSLALLILKKGSYSSFALLISLAIIFDYRLHVQRPEIFILFLLLALEPYLFKAHQPVYRILVPITIILVLIHPSVAIIGIAGLLVYHQPNLLFSRSSILISVLIMTAGLVLIYLFPTNHYTIHFTSRVFSGNQILNFLTYLKFSGFTFIGLAMMSKEIITKRFLLLFTFLWMAAALISGVYYFSLLLIPFILHLYDKHQQKWNKKNLLLLSVIAGFNIMANGLHPIFTLIENPGLTVQTHNIYHTLTTQKYPEKVYSEHSFGGALYDHLSNSRTLIYDGNVLTYVADTLKQNDKLYTYTKEKLIALERHLTSQNLRFKTELLLQPVKGNLQFTRLYLQRSDSLALWQTSIQ